MATGARGVRISVRLTPGASRNAAEGVVDGILRVRVAARPVEGAANEALRRLLAEELGVARGRVMLVSGATARTKVVELEAVEPEAVRSRWPGIAV
ncbi:MAG TPA: DUF167 domain-containing protein [Candidatus Binatia bacterium]|nr:DUF167 domain-containing protein [Candidatus Binatia bacterium]